MSIQETTRANLLRRLSRAEGQLGAIRRMLEEDEYCVDVLIQIAAVRGALGKVGQILLGSHVENCVAETRSSGDEDERQQQVEELVDVFSRFGGLGR